MAAPLPDADDLARLLQARGLESRPWVWHLLRLARLQQERDSLAPDDYLARLQEAHADLMRLGAFWEGREDEVFGGRHRPDTVLAPLPGSPEDR
jgi:hypothetical protein